MANVLILYYSSYGHIETMAGAIAEGARSGGAEVHVKRVPELTPRDVAEKSHFKLDQTAPVGADVRLSQFEDVCRLQSEPVGTFGKRRRASVSPAVGWLTQRSACWLNSRPAPTCRRLRRSRSRRW